MINASALTAYFEIACFTRHAEHVNMLLKSVLKAFRKRLQKAQAKEVGYSFTLEKKPLCKPKERNKCNSDDVLDAAYL